MKSAAAKSVLTPKLRFPEFEQTRPIRANCVGFVCVGSTIGKVGQNVRDCATNQQINSIVPNSDHEDAFVYYALVKNSDRVAKLAGIQAVPIVNKTLFSSVCLPVPKLDEQRGIRPESLSPSEDIKKLERRVKTDEMKLEKQAGRLPKPAPDAQSDDSQTLL